MSLTEDQACIRHNRYFTGPSASMRIIFSALRVRVQGIEPKLPDWQSGRLTVTSHPQPCSQEEKCSCPPEVVIHHRAAGDLYVSVYRPKTVPVGCCVGSRYRQTVLMAPLVRTRWPSHKRSEVAPNVRCDPCISVCLRWCAARIHL